MAGLSDLYNSSVQKLSDLYRAAVPTNARFLGEYLLGNRDPITAKDFNPDELQSIRDLYNKRKALNDAEPARLLDPVQAKQDYVTDKPSRLVPNPSGRGYVAQKLSYDDFLQERQQQAASYAKNPNKASIGYGDYGYPAEGQHWGTSIGKSFTDPTYNVATTLGSFNTYNEGNKIRVEDQYKFDNKDFYGTDKMNLWDILQRGSAAPASLIDMMMIKYGPHDPRPVDFTIDK